MLRAARCPVPRRTRFRSSTFSVRQRELSAGRLRHNTRGSTMDPKEQFSQVTGLLSALVEGTDVDQLSNETPCNEFDVRDLIGHFTLGRFIFAAGLSGDKARGEELVGSMPARMGDVLGGDHRATYRDASAKMDSAVSGVADLDQAVSLIFGEMPAGVAMQMISADNFVHCWDLANSTGQEFEPSDDLVEAANSFFRGFITDDMRAGGGFGAEIEVSDDAPALDRLLGFCGRKS